MNDEEDVGAWRFATVGVANPAPRSPGHAWTRPEQLQPRQLHTRSTPRAEYPISCSIYYRDYGRETANITSTTLARCAVSGSRWSPSCTKARYSFRPDGSFSSRVARCRPPACLFASWQLPAPKLSLNLVIDLVSVKSRRKV